MPKNTQFQPLPILMVNRILIVIVIGLAILAGYFHARMSNEIRISERLLSNYQTCQQALVNLADADDQPAVESLE